MLFQERKRRYDDRVQVLATLEAMYYVDHEYENKLYDVQSPEFLALPNEERLRKCMITQTVHMRKANQTYLVEMA